jgi:biotin operon repressor
MVPASENESDVERLARLFRALADPARLRILGAIAERPRSGRELSEALRLTAPTISHHMAKLADAGLVRVATEGTRHTYSLDQQVLRDAARPPAPSASDATDAATAGERERAKVLRDFFDGERLKTIPAQRKKRVVVLQHLTERFDPHRRYPEREVNEILRRAHDDVATLRRELVDYGFMRRSQGVYEVAKAPPERSDQVAQEFIGDESAWFERLVSRATHQALHSHQE